jgi:hypothetical protein
MERHLKSFVIRGDALTIIIALVWTGVANSTTQNDRMNSFVGFAAYQKILTQ